MMQQNQLDCLFAMLKRQKETALITYITAGDPDLSQTKELVQAMIAGGADIIELGVPFSDPLADGPTIQRAVARALQNGTTLRQVLQLADEMNQEGLLVRQTPYGPVEVPLVLLLYYNTIYSYGLREFCTDAAASGISGMVIPDLPPEEGQELRQYAEHSGLYPILLLAPTSSPKRVEMITRSAQGFIYYVSVSGVTGARKELRQSLAEEIGRVKELTSVPVAVGFGVSTPSQVQSLSQVADGVIVGSAIIELLEKTPSDRRPCVLHQFVQTLKRATMQNASAAV